MLGAGWQQPDRSLELQLALRLHRLQNGGPGTHSRRATVCAAAMARRHGRAGA